MQIVYPLRRKLAVAPEPWELVLGLVWFFAAILAPVDVGFGAEDAGAFLAAGDVGGHEGANVQAHAVVDVWLPADGLFVEGFPADEDVVGWFAGEDGF